MTGSIGTESTSIDSLALNISATSLLSSDELAALAATAAESAEEYSVAAEIHLEDAEDAYEAEDIEALSLAQTYTDADATNAEMEAAQAQSYVEKILLKYDAAKTANEESSDVIEAAEAAAEIVEENLQNYIDEKSAALLEYNNAYNALSAYKILFPLWWAFPDQVAAEIILSKRTDDANTAHQNALEAYTEYRIGSEYLEAISTLEELTAQSDEQAAETTEIRLDLFAASLSAASALNFAETARASSDTAAEYVIPTTTSYSCADLSLSPDSYEMTTDSVDEVINLTIGLSTTSTTVNTSTLTSFSFKNLMAFGLEAGFNPDPVDEEVITKTKRTIPTLSPSDAISSKVVDSTIYTVDTSELSSDVTVSSRALGMPVLDAVDTSALVQLLK